MIRIGRAVRESRAKLNLTQRGCFQLGRQDRATSDRIKTSCNCFRPGVTYSYLHQQIIREDPENQR